MCIRIITPMQYLCGDDETESVEYMYCKASDGWSECDNTVEERCSAGVIDEVCYNCISNSKQGKRGRFRADGGDDDRGECVLDANTTGEVAGSCSPTKRARTK